MDHARTNIVEGLRQAHTSLLEDLRKLEEAAQSSTRPEGAELTARLVATRAHIAEHFRYEEQNGYMDGVRKREPRLERTIQQLGDEHKELARSLDALIEQSRATTGPDAGQRAKVRIWVEQVRQHERRENEVVQVAFNQDIGAED
jgi:hypothetical protein